MFIRPGNKNSFFSGLPWWLSSTEFTYQFRGHNLNPWIRKTPRKEMATHSSTLAWENSMDRGVRQARVHGVAKNGTRLGD